MSALALAWEQFRFERKLFWRNPSAAFFNFVLPLLLLVLIASAFGSEADELEVLVPGIAGMSVMATTFTALAYEVTYLREEGILKRVRGTPMPAASFIGGMLGLGGGQRVRPGRRWWWRSATSSTAWTGRRTGSRCSASPRSAWSASARSAWPSPTPSPTSTRRPPT